MTSDLDHCQSSDGHRSTMPPGDETHPAPDNSEQMPESRTSDEEPLPRAPSPDQIRQSAELEPFILPSKATASLSSTTCVSPSAPQTLVPGKARSLFRVWRLEAASLLLSFSCFICKSKAPITLASVANVFGPPTQ